MQSFLIGLIALLNLPGSNGVATAATPGQVPKDELFVAARATTLASWDESALPPGTGSSTRAKHEDQQIEEDYISQDAPVLASIAEADPSTEIIDIHPDALGSASFMNARAIPVAQWKDTELREPEPPAPPPGRTTTANRPASARPDTRSSSTSAKPKAKPEPKPLPKTSGGIALTHPTGAAHKFPWGQCTYYVASRRKITFRGNAKEWLKNGKAAGYSTGDVPVVGAVAVTAESGYGHVSYVEEVDTKNRKFKISEMNYVGLGVTSTRWLSYDFPKLRGFVY